MKKTIFFAGGCFWGVQEYFSRLKGVINTTCGYANGTTAFPTYEEVKSQKTGHAETVKIEYDDSEISLEKLCEHFLRFVDPYSENKQGSDVGTQYRSGIFYNDLYDAIIVKNYLSEHLKEGYKIQVAKMCNFFIAEEYHQNYLKKNPSGYCHVNLNLIKSDERN